MDQYDEEAWKLTFLCGNCAAIKDKNERHLPISIAPSGDVWEKIKPEDSKVPEEHFANGSNFRRYLEDCRKYNIVNSLKTICCDCYYMSGDPIVYDCDHQDPGTKYKEISRMIRNNESIFYILSEMLKCDIRCKLCHTIRSIKEGHHLAYVY